MAQQLHRIRLLHGNARILYARNFKPDAARRKRQPITIARPSSDIPIPPGSGTIIGLLTKKSGPQYTSSEHAAPGVAGRVRLLDRVKRLAGPKDNPATVVTDETSKRN